jgi:hypothetical protein
MNLEPSSEDLLQRHLNGDLDDAGEAEFLDRLKGSPDLRRALASQAVDETLLSEIFQERRARTSGRSGTPWPAWAAAAAMLLSLGALLFFGNRGSLPVRVVSVDGSASRTRGGDVAALAPDMELRDGDEIRSTGTLQLKREPLRIELSGTAVLGIGAELTLVRGTMRATGPVAVRSSVGSVRTDDADLRLQVAESGLRVEVERGVVVASPLNAAAVAVAEGTAALLGGAEPIQNVRLIAPGKIRDAMSRASRFLASRRGDLLAPIADGKRHDAAPLRTYAELAALALIRGGGPESRPLVEELIGRAVGRRLESVYTAALQAKLLADVGDRDQDLRRCAQFLVDSQCANGQWDYGRASTSGEPASVGLIRRRSEGPAGGDNSVTAYAIQGLLAARRAGVEVERDVLERSRRWWLRCQNPDGGWGYGEYGALDQSGAEKLRTSSNSSYGSATASGLASVAALAEMLGSDAGSTAAIRRGIAWTAGNYSVSANPRKAPGFSHLHWFVAVARAGALLGLERFGAHEWYAEGADALLAAQQPDGAWRLEDGEFMARERRDVLDTCLAILYLRRE